MLPKQAQDSCRARQGDHTGENTDSDPGPVSGARVIATHQTRVGRVTGIIVHLDSRATTQTEDENLNL